MPDPQVTVDDEAVTFDGPVPQRPIEVLELIVAAIEPQGREVASVVLDGAPVNDVAGLEGTSFSRLEIRTVAAGAESATPSEAAAPEAPGPEEAAAARASAEAASGAVDALSDRLLTEPWSTCIGDFSAIGEKLGPLLGFLERRAACADASASAAATAYRRVEKALVSAVTAAEGADVAVLYETLRESMVPALDSACDGTGADRAPADATGYVPCPFPDRASVSPLPIHPSPARRPPRPSATVNHEHPPARQSRRPPETLPGGPSPY